MGIRRRGGRDGMVSLLLSFIQALVLEGQRKKAGRFLLDWSDMVGLGSGDGVCLEDLP